MHQVIDQETGLIVTDDQQVMRLSDVEIFLATRPPIAHAKELRDRLAGYAEYYRNDVTKYNEVYEGQLRTERYIGQMLAGVPKANGGWPTPSCGNTVLPQDAPTLTELGFTKMQSSRLQQLAAVAQDVFERYIKAQTQAVERIIKADLLTDLRPANHQLINTSTNNEWYTPQSFLDAAHEVMGGIDLDPASNATANQIVRATHYYALDDDGFAQHWNGRVWLNPPYGTHEDNESNQARWSRRLIDEYRAGNVSEAILLVNAVTGNGWFQPLKDFPICFPDGRIRFYNADTEAGQPTHGNALVYFGPNVAAFVRVFARFGAVMARLDEYDGHVFIHGLETSNVGDV